MVAKTGTWANVMVPTALVELNVCRVDSIVWVARYWLRTSCVWAV